MILSACLFYMDLVIIPQSKSLSEIGERPNMELSRNVQSENTQNLG